MREKMEGERDTQGVRKLDEPPLFTRAHGGYDISWRKKRKKGEEKHKDTYTHMRKKTKHLP